MCPIRRSIVVGAVMPAVLLSACANDTTFVPGSGGSSDSKQLETDMSACSGFWPLFTGFFAGALFGAAEGAAAAASSGGAGEGAAIGAGAGAVIGLVIGAVAVDNRYRHC